MRKYITWLLVFIAELASGQSLDTLYARSCRMAKYGAFAEAMRTNTVLLQRAEEQNDCHYLCLALYHAGEINDLLRNNQETLLYLVRGLNAAKRCGESEVVWLCTRYLGGYYMAMSNKDSAWHYLQEAYRLIQGTGQYARLASTTGMLGETRKGCFGMLDEAEKYHKLSLKYAMMSGDDNAIAYASLRYGALQATRRNNCAEGIRCVEAANDLFSKHNDFEGMCWALRSLGNVYHKCGEYEKAKDAWVRLSDAQDSVFSRQVADRTAQYRIMYETEKKEKEAVLKGKQLESERERARYQVVIFMTVIVAIIAIFLIVYYRQRYRKETETERRLAEEQLKRFRDVIDAEEKERERIARELHDGIGHLLSSAKLNASAIEDVSDGTKELVDRTMDIIDEALAETRNISHNLMPAVLSELGLRAALKQLLRKITQTGKINVELQNEDQIPALLQTKAVVLYRIIQEVVNNGLKHSGAETICINFEQEKGILSMTITDNGKGFDAGEAEMGPGIGWKNIRARVEMLKGTLNVQSSLGVGTTISISFTL